MAKYCAYGVGIDSDVPLSLPEYADGGLGHVECVSGSAAFFREISSDTRFDARSTSWYRVATLPGGATYVRWDRVGEFFVAGDGRRITFRRDEHASLESLQVYLLGQALSFALVAQRLEPLHATVVVVDGGAVAFLGSHAFGKSTLAASFVASGYRLLTDDLLLLQRVGDRLVAHPGPARLKLFPKVARRFLGEAADAVSMNAESGKLIVPIGDDRHCARPVPLDAIYSLAAPGAACRMPSPAVFIKPLSPREGFLELVRSTFNRWVRSPDRAARQFDAMSDVADALPVSTLSYPRSIDTLSAVRHAIVGDIGRTRAENGGQQWPFLSRAI